MPEVIRNRFRDPSDIRETEYQDAARTRPGFGIDEDPLAELARIVGDTAPASTYPTSHQAGQRTAAQSAVTAGQRDYPRRDTSWRDPQARTTVRAGITPQPMPGQLDELEAELFSEIRSENLRSLPPAPDLAQLGLSDPRAPQFPVTSAPIGQGETSARPMAGRDYADLDDEVTLPMHSVLRATPPSARASENHAMQQPPRHDPAPVQHSAPAAGRDVYAESTHYPDTHYAGHDDFDPAGALGGAYDDYDQSETAYYAAEHENPSSMPARANQAGSGHPPMPAYARDRQDYADDSRFEGDDDGYVAGERRSSNRRHARARGFNPILLGAIGIVGVAVLGVGGLFTYRAIAGVGATGINAPLIHADTKPMKELVAQQPVGAAGPNLDTARSDSPDKLVTRTEDPVDQIPGKPPIRVVGLGTQTPSLAPVQRVHSVIVRPDGTIVTPEEAAAAQPLRTASLPTDASAAPVPAPAKPTPTVALTPPTPAQSTPVAALPAATAPAPLPVARTEPTAAAPKPAPVAPAVVPKPAAAQAPVPVPAKPVKPVAVTPTTQPSLVPHPQTTDNAPLSLGPSNGAQQPTPVPTQPVRVATATATASAPAPRAVTTDAAGDYMVQISSQRSDVEAHHALQVATQKYAALGVKGGDVQQADLGARGTYYRARLAGGSHEQALALCTQIKAQGGDCVVAKR